jgi:hypothetical protein
MRSICRPVFVLPRPARWCSAGSIRCAVFASLLLVAAGPAAAQPVFFDGFEPPAAEACDDPLIAPLGWDTQSKNWVDAWSSPDGSPRATYPNSVGFPVPIGANKNKITVINFVPLPNQTVDISWDGAQANLEQGYYPRPAMSMFISISPCPGDVRPPDQQNADPFLHQGCRTGGGGGSMFFSTVPGGTDFVCRLEAGQTYFMNIAPIDPTNGLQPGEHTCDDSSMYSEQGCDVQAVHRGVTH